MLSSHPCSSECVLLLPFGLADVGDVDVGCVLCVRLFVFLFIVFMHFQNGGFHLAIHGCCRWEIKHAGGLYMLWKHVDGSP